MKHQKLWVGWKAASRLEEGRVVVKELLSGIAQNVITAFASVSFCPSSRNSPADFLLECDWNKKSLLPASLWTGSGWEDCCAERGMEQKVRVWGYLSFIMPESSLFVGRTVSWAHLPWKHSRVAEQFMLILLPPKTEKHHHDPIQMTAQNFMYDSSPLQPR